MKHRLYICSVGIFFCLATIASPCKSEPVEPKDNLIKDNLSSLQKENDLLRLQIDILNSRLQNYKQETASVKAKDTSTVEITHGNLAYLYAQKGDLEAAIREYLEELKNNPNDSDAHYNLGCLYAKQGKFTEAVQEFEAVLVKKPDDKEACFNLAVIYSKNLKDTKKAEEYQKKFMENNGKKK